jgi:phosphatidylethanolamine-binding protein (PEBP) family uncharacterized protein
MQQLDLRASCCIGGAPDANGRDFHYAFVVHALDVRSIDVPDYSTPAYFFLQAQNHLIARATLVTTALAPAPRPRLNRAGIP